MPVVRVDDEVWEWLKTHATPFEDTPNSVLRRLARLDENADASAEHGGRNRGRRKQVASAGSATREVHNSQDYVVRKKPDKFAHWWFQIYQRKLAKNARRGDFAVVVVCDQNAPSEVVFRVPYSYLRDHILPKAKLEPDKRYMFEVKKDSSEFVFHSGIRFDGKRFLERQSHESRSQSQS